MKDIGWKDNTQGHGEAYRIATTAREKTLCPKCGSEDLERSTIESVPGYGAGPTVTSCQECGHILSTE